MAWDISDCLRTWPKAHTASAGESASSRVILRVQQATGCCHHRLGRRTLLRLWIWMFGRNRLAWRAPLRLWLRNATLHSVLPAALLSSTQCSGCRMHDSVYVGLSGSLLFRLSCLGRRC